MPIVIWGSRGLTSNLESGDFHCPACEEKSGYTLKQVTPWFTLYFIPLFPCGSAQRYVECRECGRTFKEEVLEYTPPSETDRFFRGIYEDLREGMSYDRSHRKLKEAGLSDADATELLDKMCDGNPRTCSCGERLHPDVRECRYCGAKL